MKTFLFWFAAGDVKHFSKFRYDDLIACADLCGIRESIHDRSMFVEEIDEEKPYAILRLPSEEIAIQMSQRAVLTFGIFEIWAESTDEDSLLEKVTALGDDPAKQKYFEKDNTFCARVRSYGKSNKNAEHLRIINKFIKRLPFKGKVKLEDPNNEFWIMYDYRHVNISPEEAVARPPSAVFFARKIAKTERDSLLKDYTLKSRNYLGTTSTKAELAFLMANQVQAKKGSLILDPFAGTGSILIACTVFKAFSFGTDIDIRALLGDISDPTKPPESNLFSNFEQYGLCKPEIVRADSGRPVFRRDFVLDGIVCDPPYGVRAGARKTGTDKGSHHIPDEYRETHIPRTRAYEVQDLMKDLLNFAALRLRMFGRISFLLPTSSEYTENDLPKHPCFELVGNAEQVLTRNFRRRLVTMVKVVEPTEEAEVYSEAGVQPSFTQFKKIFHKHPSKRLQEPLEKKICQ